MVKVLESWCVDCVVELKELYDTAHISSTFGSFVGILF